jgi:hypothetical protein
MTHGFAPAKCVGISLNQLSNKWKGLFVPKMTDDTE